MTEFSQLGLSQPLLDAITAMGFETPTPIQQQAIPKLLENNTDLVGLAQTGTGKTAAFGLPLIDLINTDENHVQALVLAPTRELCLQISKELELFSKKIKALKVYAVYGGTDINRQMRDIRNGVHVVAATPGRLRDLINRRAIKLDKINYVVLDEADEMLNMGFKEEIDAILENTSDDKLTWLFSATMPKEVRRIAQNYMENPLEISVGSRNTTNMDITHQYVITRPRERYETLRRFLDADPDTFGLVFTRTRRDAKEVADMLTRDGYNADALHGDLNQHQRDRVMNNFRTKRLKVLIATDVAARGIDVDEISHVFHYNIPDDISFYTHRAGRTGRAGNKGISLVLAHPKDLHLLRKLERISKAKFTLAHIPTGKEICEQRLIAQLNRLKDTEIGEDIEAFLPQIEASLGELTKEELMKKVATASFNRFIKTYRHAPDLNPRKGKRNERNDKRERNRDGQRSNQHNNSQMKRFFINIGEMDVQDKGGFISLVCQNAGIPGAAIGKINLNRKHTFFDVEQDVAQKVKDAFDNSNFEGRSVRINEGEMSSSSRGGQRRDKRRNMRRDRRTSPRRSS